MAKAKPKYVETSLGLISGRGLFIPPFCLFHVPVSGGKSTGERQKNLPLTLNVMSVFEFLIIRFRQKYYTCPLKSTYFFTEKYVLFCQNVRTFLMNRTLLPYFAVLFSFGKHCKSACLQGCSHDVLWAKALLVLA